MPRVSAADTALLFGYVLAIPFTVFVPGFLRLWRRREIEVLATAQVGTAVVVAAWFAKGQPVVAALHLLWLVGFTAAWVREGSRGADH